jgi:hypothetical protein
MSSNRNQNTDQKAPPDMAGTAPATTSTATTSVDTSPDNKSKADVGGDAIEKRQRELRDQEVELQRKAAEVEQRARSLDIETERRDREWRASHERLRAQGVHDRGPVGAAIPGELLSTETPLTADRSPWDELAVDPHQAKRHTAEALASKNKGPTREEILHTHDFETIAKVKTATGYVPARTRIRAGTMSPELLSDAWARNVVRPYEAPPPPPPPERPAASAHVGRPNPNR